MAVLSCLGKAPLGLVLVLLAGNKLRAAAAAGRGRAVAGTEPWWLLQTAWRWFRGGIHPEKGFLLLPLTGIPRRVDCTVHK